MDKSNHPWRGNSPIRTVEVITFADRRITLGPKVGHIAVDYRSVRTDKRIFEVGYVLARRLDTNVSHKEIIALLWGWSQEQPERILRREISNRIGILRKLLGSELGDPAQGAIRTVNQVGYMAVSHL